LKKSRGILQPGLRSGFLGTARSEKEPTDIHPLSAGCTFDMVALFCLTSLEIRLSKLARVAMQLFLTPHRSFAAVLLRRITID